MYHLVPPKFKNERFQRKIPPSNDSSLSISISMMDASESLPNFAVQVSHGQWWSRGIELPFTPKETSSRSGAVWKCSSICGFHPFVSRAVHWCNFCVLVEIICFLGQPWAKHGKTSALLRCTLSEPYWDKLDLCKWWEALDLSPENHFKFSKESNQIATSTVVQLNKTISSNIPRGSKAQVHVLLQDIPPNRGAWASWYYTPKVKVVSNPWPADLPL